jgi:hypothetical protein
MNTNKVITLRSWGNLLLFEFAGLGLCFMLSILSLRCVPFRTPEIAEQAFPYILGGIVFLWIMISLLSLKFHRGGIDVWLQIIASAVISAPFATMMFVVLFESKNESVTGWSLIGFVVYFTLVATGLSLIFGNLFVEISKSFGEKMWKIYNGMGF